MGKQLFFATKEDNNKRREQEFLTLTPHQRVCWFLASFKHTSIKFPRSDIQNSNNFILTKKYDRF
jgi:hypothetical protein